MNYENNPNNLNGGFSRQYTLEELVDLVNAELTFDCALPQVLPTRTIQRVITTQAQPWFYQNYRYAVQSSYYFIERRLLETEQFARHKWIFLPQEIQSVVWLYKVNKNSMFDLGINSPNLSVNLGVSNQPYLSSYVTTIGELGVYKTVLDSFSDMLDQLSLQTVKYDYNQMANRLQILTNLREDLIAECYVNIEPEHLYADPLFIEYVMGVCKMKIGEMVGRFDFKLPGNVTYNSSMMLEEGRQMKDKVVEKIEGLPNSDFLIMIKK